MKSFVYNGLPMRVVFGVGAVKQLGAELDRLGAKRALLLCTPGRAEDANRIARGLPVAGVFTNNTALDNGGEHIKLAINRPRRSVKKLLQEARLSQWQRQALPLVWCGDTLAAVPGIGVDLAFQAEPNEPAWNLAWLPYGRAATRLTEET